MCVYVGVRLIFLVRKLLCGRHFDQTVKERRWVWVKVQGQVHFEASRNERI